MFALSGLIQIFRKCKHMSHCENLWDTRESIYVHNFISRCQACLCVCVSCEKIQTLMARGNNSANAAQGPAELTTKRNPSVIWIRSDSHFSPLLDQQALMSQASHNAPSCSTYIIESPLTAACPEKPHEPLIGISAFKIVFHISLCPLNPQDSLHILTGPLSLTLHAMGIFHTNQEYQDWGSN